MTTVIFPTDGTFRALYDDDTAEALREIGAFRIRRASHVEPTDDGRWTADMSPVRGPLLGPYDDRQEALEAEVAWLAEHNYPFPED